MREALEWSNFSGSMLQDRAPSPRRYFAPLSVIAFVSDRRAGILPKRNALSKRKFHEAKALAPHTMHSFSTAAIRAKIF
jgi:hypothetical protein